MTMRSLSTPTGSSLQLWSNCTFDPSKHYELQVIGHMIGSYIGQHLVTRLQFSNRLQFDKENCSFILMNLTETDSNIYTFITKSEQNWERIQKHEEHFNVTITEHISPAAPVNKTTPDEDSIYGHLAVCFLLDASMAVLVRGIYLLLLRLVKKRKKNTSEERSSCLHSVCEFILGDPFQKAAGHGFEFGDNLALLSQLVGSVLFIVWIVHGHGHSVIWVICSAISLFVGIVITCSRCECSRLQEDLSGLLHLATFLWPPLTSGSIAVAFCLVFQNIAVIWKTWYLVAASISLSIRVLLIGLFYWKLKDRKEKNNGVDNGDPNLLL